MRNSSTDTALTTIEDELQQGIVLKKCRQCGCMADTLKKLVDRISEDDAGAYSALRQKILQWQKQMQPVKYSCLGCSHCYPAEAIDAFRGIFPQWNEDSHLDYNFNKFENTWPPVAGEYYVLGRGSTFPVAVSTLASSNLAEDLANIRPAGLSLVGKTETENIGIEKIIKNMVSNPSIHFLLLAGNEAKGHYSGKTLLALWENGVDGNMKINGSPGKRPVLRNVTRQEVETFRRQVRVINRIGLEDAREIAAEIPKIAERDSNHCGCQTFNSDAAVTSISKVHKIVAAEPSKVEMDKAGYFVILPRMDKKIILVEHYDYENRLLRVIEGKTARSIYWSIIRNRWVSQLSHAAYLGKELARAELSLKMGFKYVQDGA